MDEEKEKYPNYPYIISEYGAGSDRRLHTFKPESFDFSIEHQQNYHEHYLPAIMERGYITGSTMWNFIDFGSANRDESMPRINNKGLVYSDRTTKDIYYYYKAFLNKTPMVYVATRDWQSRTVTDDIKTHPIKVYTNQEQVELFINGVSNGVKKVENNTIVWDVVLNEGRNFIHAKSGNLEDAYNVTLETIPTIFNKKDIGLLEFAINVGSNCYFTDDDSKLTWVPDRPYTSGGWGYVGGDVYRKTSSRIGTQTEIKSTRNTPLLQTSRIGLDAYRIDLPDGDYELELFFADPFGQAESTLHALGGDNSANIDANIFDVIVNGDRVIEKLNLQQDYGAFTNVRKRFLVKAKDGKGVEVIFNAIKGRAILNALKIRKL
jgi:beta-galactosidase